MVYNAMINLISKLVKLPYNVIWSQIPWLKIKVILAIISHEITLFIQPRPKNIDIGNNST